MRMRPDAGRLKAITRLISVLLPDPLDPTSAVVVPAGALKLTSFSTRNASVVFEGDVLEDYGSVERTKRRLLAVLVVFGVHLEELANPVEPGERLANLRTD